MVDYSKWDTVGDSSDDDEGRLRPQVTKLEGPSVVQLGAGASVTYGPKQDPKKMVKVEPAAHPGRQELATLTERGGKTDTHLWSQHRESVVAHLIVPASTRAKDVRVSITEKELEVTLGDETFLNRPFRHPIEPPSEELDCDWELLDSDVLAPARLLRIDLKKKSPQGVTVWWDALFKGDDPIDVANLDGRQRSKQSEFAKSWEEAHRMFRQQVQGVQPIELDVQHKVPSTERS